MNDPAAPTNEPVPGEGGDQTAIASPEPAALESSGDVGAEREPADLDAIGRDLDGVEVALGRLDDGSYWTDEVTGEPIPDEVLAADPVARRADPSAA